MADLMLSLCMCASCELDRSRQGRVCMCCGGSHMVPAATGEMRPCSICSADRFDVWAASRLASDDAHLGAPA